MANTVIGATVQVDFQSVGNMRKALKEANQELLAMQDKFGAASTQAIDAARKVADLKDRIDDARETADLFDPGKKFQAFVTLGSQIAAGFSAVQGAMALVGAESEDVQKALLKVQGAMALAQGLSQLKDLGKSWQQLKIFVNAATQGVSGFKKALISSGIGALVVAVGTLVAYWDDIKGLVNGVSKEQEKLNEQTEKNLKAEQEKMDALNSSDEILKLQGKSEKEILQIKMSQLKLVIAESKARIEQAEITKVSQIAAAKRNNELTKMVIRGAIEANTAILRALAAPIDLIILTVNQVSDVLGFGKVVATTINEEITKMNVAASDWVANQLFDPEKVKTEADESIKTMKSTLLQQENQYAGYQNQLNGANNKGNKDRSEANEQAANEENKRREEADQVVAERRKSLMTKRDQELLDIDKKYNEDLIKLTGRSEEEINILKESYRRQRSEVEDQYRKEQKEKEKEFANEINKINEEIRLAGIKDQREKEKAELQITHQEQLSQIAANENLNFMQRLALTVALRQKQRQEEVALEDKFKQEDLQKKQEFNNQILQAEIELQNATFAATSAGLNALESLAGKNKKLANAFFVIDKALAIVKIIMDTQREIASYYAAGAASPMNLIVPGSGMALATKQAIAAKIRAAGSIATISATSIGKFMNGSGGGGTGPTPPPPPGNLNAPMQPGLSPAVQGQALNAQAINDLGNQSLRAYVMNSDIQNNNQRNAYLERNARIG